MDSSRKAASNIEFLEFLADISNPATGDISASRLASWLYQTEAALNEKWRMRGNIAWGVFADEVLAVLDAAQNQICDLNAVVEWYLGEPIANFGMDTPQQLVVTGKARSLAVAIRSRKVLLPYVEG